MSSQHPRFSRPSVAIPSLRLIRLSTTTEILRRRRGRWWRWGIAPEGNTEKTAEQHGLLSTDLRRNFPISCTCMPRASASFMVVGRENKTTDLLLLTSCRKVPHHVCTRPPDKGQNSPCLQQ